MAPQPRGPGVGGVQALLDQFARAGVRGGEVGVEGRSGQLLGGPGSGLGDALVALHQGGGVLGGDCVAAPADLFKERIRRQPVLGGPINEYERAA